MKGIRISLASQEDGLDPDVLECFENVSPHKYDRGQYVDSKVRCVYFAQNEQGLIKIGVTGNVKQRLSALASTTRSIDLRLLAVIAGASHTLERSFHREFKASHVCGEWFRPTKDLLDAIWALRELDHAAVYMRRTGEILEPTGIDRHMIGA